jgi:hypothetical protein
MNHTGRMRFCGGWVVFLWMLAGSAMAGDWPAFREVLAVNDLGEPSNATPAFSDGQVFLRTDGHLYCVAED